MSILNDNLPEVIDLFSGCGGLALGFQKAGFHISDGIELMPEAVETASYNLHWRFGEESSHVCGDITKMDFISIKEKLGGKDCIVIGGPPCQAYSLAGRAKLRSLGEERINVNDKRGYLYQDFLRFALGLDARAIIMENVPESTDFGGENIPQKVCDILLDNGYYAYWTILNSADYGVPQIRERVFVIATKQNLGEMAGLPVPTHVNPNGKPTQVQQRFKSFEQEYKSFRVPNMASGKLEPWVTVGEAFSDLPVLFPKAQSKYVLNKITMPLEYRTEAQCKYQHLMREWYGKDPGAVSGNCFRKTVRDYRIFEQMKPGDGYVEASEIADELFKRACIAQGITEYNAEKYEKLKKEIVPPYDRDNFKSKWQRLNVDIPSHTVVAHLSVDTYSHIHPIEPRGISVREAARLQSFPDGFLFQCAMGDAFKQIGNAVPPLVANAIAKQVKALFEGGK